MTDLRSAAQQALEALGSAEVDPHSSDAVYKAITALRAALVEDAMQKFTDVNQELEAALAKPVGAAMTDFANWLLSVYNGQHAFKNLEEALRSAWDAGAAAEREACAKVCDVYAANNPENFADICAAAIRARKDKQ